MIVRVCHLSLFLVVVNVIVIVVVIFVVSVVIVLSVVAAVAVAVHVSGQGWFAAQLEEQAISSGFCVCGFVVVFVSSSFPFLGLVAVISEVPELLNCCFLLFIVVEVILVVIVLC